MKSCNVDISLYYFRGRRREAASRGVQARDDVTSSRITEHGPQTVCASELHSEHGAREQNDRRELGLSVGAYHNARRTGEKQRLYQCMLMYAYVLKFCLQFLVSKIKS